MEIKIDADPRKISEIMDALRNINGVSIPVNYDINADGDYVDLGLPSGTLWATCNLGANKPEEYGKYFAWGDTEGHTSNTNDGYFFNWASAPFNNGDSVFNEASISCTKNIFCPNGVLAPKYDAATHNLGDKWRMPTHEEWKELVNYTTVTWTQVNGIYGRKFRASNGKSIFLPASGYRSNISLDNQGSYGYYWSSSLNVDYPNYAWVIYFNSDYQNPYYYNTRYNGFCIRPVMSKH